MISNQKPNNREQYKFVLDQSRPKSTKAFYQFVLFIMIECPSTYTPLNLIDIKLFKFNNPFIKPGAEQPRTV